MTLARVRTMSQFNPPPSGRLAAPSTPAPAPSELDPRHRSVADWSLVVLALAGLVGVWFRLQVLGVVQTGYLLENIRHAHSHLVLFGWALPAMFVALSTTVRPSGAMPPTQHLNALVMLVLALLSAPFFARWGYGSAVVGSARLPLGVIVSGLSMFAWYVWMFAFMRRPPRAAGEAPRCCPAADALAGWAVGFLLGASAVAWGVAVVQALGATQALISAMTHAFLHLLVVGFLANGALALVLAPVGPVVGSAAGSVAGSVAGPHRAWADAIALGVVASMLADLPDPRLAFVGRAGFVLLGVAGLVLLGGGVRAGRARSAAGVFGLLRSGAEIAVGLMGAGAAALLHEPSMRVLYLHVALVGFVSTVLVERLFGAVFGSRALRAALSAVALSLLPLSTLWPAAWRGAWTWWLATLAGAGVVAAAALVAARVAVRASERTRPVGKSHHAATAAGAPHRPSHTGATGGSPGAVAAHRHADQTTT